MGEGNIVIFKGSADGITAILDEKSPFEDILEHFKQKLIDSKEFFKGSKVSMKFTGRKLNQSEQDSLIEFLRKQNIVNISFIHPFENEIAKKTSDSDGKKPDENIIWIKGNPIDIEASPTYFHYGIIRSGSKLNYSRNIVIFGDVNPGGEVHAGGSAIIFGTVKGRVHVGLDPRAKRPFIASKGMAPIQIGIRNVIAPCPQDKGGYDVDSMQIAYIENEQIYVDILDSTSINHMLSTNDK